MATLIVFLAFFIGSIPAGYLVGRFNGVDVRSAGSGNVGATNLARVVGSRAGIVTVVLDALKGAVAALLPYFFGLDSELGILLGFLALVGHCYSPFLKFKGGKGVATGVGGFLVSIPLVGVGLLVVFGIVFYLTRIVSLSSISAAIALPFMTYYLSSSFTGPVIATFAGIIVLVRHRENIFRLLTGKEPKFSLKPKV